MSYWLDSNQDITTPLACGYSLREHDRNGDCNQCEICGEGCCPAQAEAEDIIRDHRAPDVCHHRACLKREKLAQVVGVMRALVDAARQLDEVEEEGLLIEGRAAAGNSEASEAVEMIQAWLGRNRERLAGLERQEVRA